jgi:hypothetical protein
MIEAMTLAGVDKRGSHVKTARAFSVPRLSIANAFGPAQNRVPRAKTPQDAY